MSEEMSFAVLVHMMDELNLREFFHPSMVGFQLACYQLENLIKVTKNQGVVLLPAKIKYLILTIYDILIN